MISKTKSMLMFFVAGPIIAVIVGNGGHPIAFFPPLLFIAIIKGAPTSLLAGAIFNISMAAITRTHSNSSILFGLGVAVGGVSGAISAKLTMYLPFESTDSSNYYLYCGAIGAFCGAISCMKPINRE